MLSCTGVFLGDRCDAFETRVALDAVSNGVAPFVQREGAARRERPRRRGGDASAGRELEVTTVVERRLAQQATPSPRSSPHTEVRDGPVEVGRVPAGQRRLPVSGTIAEFDVSAKKFVRENTPATESKVPKPRQRPDKVSRFEVNTAEPAHIEGDPAGANTT